MKILESYSAIAKSLLIEADDDRFVSIGYGRYKLKGKEEDDDADVYTKTDSGQFVKSADKKSDDEKGGEEKPKGGGMGAGDFERDFDDSDDEPDYGDTRNAQHFSAEPEDKPFGGDTGKDADFGAPEDGKAKDDISNKILSQSDDPEAESYPLDDFSDALTSGPDAKELRKRVDSGEEAYYVQTDEMDGFVVYDDGDVYEVHGDQGGDAWVTKTDDWSGGKDESITINGKKYRPIKESKKHILKENYERLFRSLK